MAASYRFERIVTRKTRREKQEPVFCFTFQLVVLKFAATRSGHAPAGAHSGN
jgi:hypothetical protein